jgi:hypothetical protein
VKQVGIAFMCEASWGSIHVKQVGIAFMWIEVGIACMQAGVRPLPWKHVDARCRPC